MFKTGIIHTNGLPSFGWLQVQGEHTSVTVKIYAEGNLVHTATVTNNTPQRLPAVRARYWEIQVESTSRFAPGHGIEQAGAARSMTTSPNADATPTTPRACRRWQRRPGHGYRHCATSWKACASTWRCGWGRAGDYFERAVTFRDLDPLIAELDARLSALERLGSSTFDPSDLQRQINQLRADIQYLRSQLLGG